MHQFFHSCFQECHVTVNIYASITASVYQADQKDYLRFDMLIKTAFQCLNSFFLFFPIFLVFNKLVWNKIDRLRQFC